MKGRATYFEVRSVVASDKWTVALRQDHNLLLDVLDLILSLFKIDYLDGHNLLRPVVNTLEHFAERALADTLLFGKYQLRIHLLQQQRTRTIFQTLVVVKAKGAVNRSIVITFFFFSFLFFSFLFFLNSTHGQSVTS